MQPVGGPGRLLGLLFLAIVIVAIAALLGGFGVPVGVGALAGLILGMIAGFLGTLWLGRGAGRSINLGGVAWSSEDVALAPSAELVTKMRELTEILEIDLGPTQSVLPVLATVEAAGHVVQLVAVELHTAGATLSVDIRLSPGVPLPPSLAQVAVTDDVGTRYRASGQARGGGPNRVRFEIAVIPALPSVARTLAIRIDRFVDLFPGVHRSVVGPWSFVVTLSSRDA